MIPTLAHLGGIDEIGVFLIPVVLAILALRWAESRAKHKADSTQADASSRGRTPDSGSEND